MTVPKEPNLPTHKKIKKTNKNFPIIATHFGSYCRYKRLLRLKGNRVKIVNCSRNCKLFQH